MSEDFALIQKNTTANLGVDIHIFVTGQQESKPDLNIRTLEVTAPTTSVEESATASKEKFDYADKHDSGGGPIDNTAVNLKSGRPSVKEMLGKEVSVCDESVAVCGKRSLYLHLQTFRQRELIDLPSVWSSVTGQRRPKCAE